ncbi:MAG: hypothetical protein ACOYOH_11940 [Paracraurococcus sp.]
MSRLAASTIAWLLGLPAAQAEDAERKATQPSCIVAGADELGRAVSCNASVLSGGSVRIGDGTTIVQNGRVTGAQVALRSARTEGESPKLPGR